MGRILFTERELIKMIWYRFALICLDVLTWIWHYSGWELKELGSLEFMAGLAATTCIGAAICWDTGDNTVRRYRFPRVISAMIGLPSILCTALFYFSE